MKSLILIALLALLDLVPVTVHAQSGCAYLTYQGQITYWCPGYPWPPTPTVPPPPASPTPKVLALLVQFADSPAPLSPTTMQQTIDGVSAAWKGFSYGKLDMQPEIVSVKIAQRRSNGCALSTTRTQANAAALKAGKNPADYEWWIYLMPSGYGCPGIAQANDKRSIYVYGNASKSCITAHEVGHALRLGHAQSATCNASHTTCTRGTEYSDKYNVMAATGNHCNLEFPSAWALNKMLYLDADQVARHDGPGKAYTLTPLETKGGLKTVTLKAPNRTYWLEYRQNQPGLTVRYVGAGCWDTCVTNYALPVNNLWSDGQALIFVTSLDASGLTVRVKN